MSPCIKRKFSQRIEFRKDLEFLKFSKISNYWIHQLSRLEKSSVRLLIPHLTTNNLLGFEASNGPPKKGTLLDFTIKQKMLHEDKIILMRTGDFYESYGVDALMLINYCGLNPMGYKCKAGCPVKNIQQTLDDLTNAGFNIAVYEELATIQRENDLTSSPKIKERFLSQIVSPGSSTYTYDLCLRSDDIVYKTSSPIFGIVTTTFGYTLCEIQLDERIMVVVERLTREALKSIILQKSPTLLELVYIQDCSASDLPFLSDSSKESLIGYSDGDFPNQVLRRVVRKHSLSMGDFQVHSLSCADRPRPLYSSTALQIGLMASNHVPDLVSSLLPHTEGVHAKNAQIVHFLRRWLLVPPSAEMADRMRSLCLELSRLRVAVPICQPFLANKAIGLISARQGNSNLFCDIRDTLSNMMSMFNLSAASLGDPSTSRSFRSITQDLTSLTAYDTGITDFLASDDTPYSLAARCQEVEQLISTVVAEPLFQRYDGTAEEIEQFFWRNESSFRGRVREEHAAVRGPLAELSRLRAELRAAVTVDRPSHLVLEIDVFNNLLLFRDGPRSRKKTKLSQEEQEQEQVMKAELITPRDRFNRPIDGRHTTRGVEAALSAYSRAAQTCLEAVRQLLQGLNDSLATKHLPLLRTASRWMLLLQTAHSHTAAARQQGWSLPTLVDFPSDSNSAPQLILPGLVPYWLPDAVPNDVVMDGLFLLTAPNMAGKTTLLRSVLAAALLARCGLFVPCSGRATVPRFDSFFLRTAGQDAPSEGKSCFAMEMEDVRVVLRDSTRRSLVLLDEIGRGTSSRDGAALAGALLEELDGRHCLGAFSTHLHELFSLPLRLSPRVLERRMAVSWANAESGLEREPQWSYRLEAGRSGSSLAVHTARRVLGADGEQLLMRTEQLQEALDRLSGRQRESDPAVQIVSKSPADYQQYSLDGLLTALRTVSEMESWVEVCGRWATPAAFEGCSAVYLLLLSDPSQRLPDRVYVGETASLQQRLQQHRRRLGVELKTCLAVQTTNKSAARRLETRLQRRLKRLGYEVLGDGDAAHRLFGEGDS